jgi:hypothetical protein
MFVVDVILPAPRGRSLGPEKIVQNILMRVSQFETEYRVERWGKGSDSTLLIFLPHEYQAIELRRLNEKLLQGASHASR